MSTIERDICDGFAMSNSQLLVPTSYRALILGQMDVLRRASAFRPRHYIVPDSLEEPIAAYSQVEYQIAPQPGSFLWGLSFAMFASEVDSGLAPLVHVQITDVCTETPLFSDYPRAMNFLCDPTLIGLSGQFATGTFRAPHLLSQPRIIGDPAKLDCEIYNSNSAEVHCQLVLFIAEPCLPPDQFVQLLKAQGVYSA
jgi:hypothetical protein